MFWMIKIYSGLWHIRKLQFPIKLRVTRFLQVKYEKWQHFKSKTFIEIIEKKSVI